MTEQFKYVKLGAEGNLFRVHACDAGGQPTEDCAVFRWIDASRAKPPSVKNLQIFPFRDAYEDSDGKIDVERLVAVLRFCFTSAVELTPNLPDQYVYKLHCDHDLVQAVYSSLAAELEKTGLYRVELYRRWIEIWNK